MTRFHETGGMHIGFAGVAAICGMFLAAATPAAAANIDQVRAACAKNPACKAIPSQPGDKGQDFCIDEPGGTVCDKLVWCPGDRSDCGVIGIVAGQRKPLPNLSASKVLLNSR